jgi:hypothetical protein
MAKKTPLTSDVPSPTMTKTEAVKLAVEKGKDKPREGVAWIKETYGLDVSPDYFSTTKSALKATGKAKAPSSSPKEKGGEPGALVELARDLEALRRLRAKYGAEEIKRLLEES